MYYLLSIIQDDLMFIFRLETFLQLQHVNTTFHFNVNFLKVRIIKFFFQGLFLKPSNYIREVTL